MDQAASESAHYRPTGVGKTWIACAIAHKACRLGFTAQYYRLSRLFDELSYAHADGRYPLLMKKTRQDRRHRP